MRFLTNLVAKGWEWTKNHWKSLAALAASALVFSAVCWLMPVAVPMLATMAIAGFLSGAVGAIVGDLLDRHTPTIRHVLLAATISTILSVGSFGVAKWVAPYLPRVSKPVMDWVLRPAISTIGKPAVTAITNGVVAVAEPVVMSGLRAAEASVGAVGNEVARSLRDQRDRTATEAQPDPPLGTPSRSQGLTGALSNTTQ